MASYFPVIPRFIPHQISYHSTLYFRFFFFLCVLLFSCHFPFYPPLIFLSFYALFPFLLLPLWRFLLSVVSSPISFPQPSLLVTAALQFHIWSKYTVFVPNSTLLSTSRLSHGPSSPDTSIFCGHKDNLSLLRGHSAVKSPGLKMLKVLHHHAKCSSHSTLH